MRSDATTLPQPGDQPTLSSLEIAERTGKRHDHVMADSRSMLRALGVLNELSEGAPSFRGTYRTAQGKEAPCFNLPKRECLILVSGYSVELRAAIIDRWQELEQAQAPCIPTHVEALRLAADAIERAEQVLPRTLGEPTSHLPAGSSAITRTTRKKMRCPSQAGCLYLLTSFPHVPQGTSNSSDH